MKTMISFLIILSLLLSAFFSGSEIAYVSSNKLKLELDKKSGKFYSKFLESVFKSPSRFIATMLVGNNVSLVIYGLIMAKILEPVLELCFSSSYLILTFQTVISTLVILVVAEFLPKVLFRLRPNKFLNILVFPLYVFNNLLFPIVKIIILISKIFLNIIGLKLEEKDVVFKKVDLEEYLKLSSKNDQEEVEIQILQNALDFSNVKVRECMVPRTEIIALSVNENIESLNQIFVSTGLSKVLIYNKSIDNIIGYAHSIEMFKNPKNIKSILLPISIIPETMYANELMEIFIKERKGIAIVVDEFGGTSGIITIEDVMEEIFGEIEDEYDKDKLIEIVLDDNNLLLSARIEVDYLNDKYSLKLPKSESYETLSGLLNEHFECIPKKGDKIKIDQYLFIIEQVTEKCIKTIKLLRE